MFSASYKYEARYLETAIALLANFGANDGCYVPRTQFAGMADKEEQDNEVLALKSIYDASVLRVEGCYPEGKFQARVTLPKPFRVLIPSVNTPGEVEEISLEHMPPLLLDFQLPPNYPSSSAPRFCLSCPWLTLNELELLAQALDRSWEQDPNAVVLYRWMELLDTEAADILELTSRHSLVPLFRELTGLRARRFTLPKWKKCYAFRGQGRVDLRVFKEAVDPRALAKFLTEYNSREKQRVFSQQWLTCQVCFTTKLGSEFERVIGCEHPFCRDCLREHFRVAIESGYSSQLRCPHESCTMQVFPTQVRALLGAALGSRYEENLFRAYLDSQEDLTYCPRPQCQLPVVLDPGQPMAQCSSCQFVFCIYCHKTYHGVQPCLNNAGKRALRDEYLSSTPAAKREMEKRHGKRTLQFAVDETLTEDWIQENSKKCPQCGIFAEKEDGCNKMTCWRCNAHFCWICGVALKTPINPYDHYSDPSSPCFNKLFEGAEEIRGYVPGGDDHEFGEFI